MKNLILTFAFVLVTTLTFASKKTEEIKSVQNVKIEHNSINDIHNCTLSATGTVESAEFGTMTVTITVKGACDSSLSKKLIKAIADFREQAA